ncbi:hypothetical protein BOX15_Mlig004509g1 [Macrostomum lignano]|nr:hypothetical protein BOX15_Mlig004509g1 [Macrostomum lignano]
MMPPPAPPMTPFEKVADWTRVQSRHWKGRCRNQAKSLENNTSLFAHPNSYEVLRDRNNSVWNWNVDLDAEDSAESVEIEHVSESVKSDRVSESVPSNVPRRSRRKKDVGKASCATRRSSRLSAKANTLESVSVAASSVSGQSLLRRSSRTRRAPCCSCIGCGDSVSAVSSVSCHLEKGRGREKKSDVVPSAPTRRSERLKNQQQVVNYANSLPRKQRLTNAENHICEPVRSSPRKTAPLQQEQQDKRQSDNIPATSTYSSPRKTRATQEKPDEAIRSSPRKRPTMEQQPAKENVPQSSTSEESAQDAPIVEDEIGDPNLPKCLRNPFTDQFKKMRQDFFNENITKVSHLKQCYVCREKFPGKYFSIDSEDMCDRCFRDDNEPKSFSQENNAIPMLEQPEDLQDLSVAEQMLISPVLSVIVVVQIFPQKQTKSRGHGIMLPQDQSHVLRELPRRSLPVVLMYDERARVQPGEAQSGTMNNLRVRRDKVTNAMRYLMANNKYFRQYQVSMNNDALLHLPEDGYAHQVEGMIVEMQSDNEVNFEAAQQEGGSARAERLQQQVEKNADETNELEETISSLLETPLRRLESAVRDKFLSEKLKWPARSNEPVNEFQDEGYFTLAYPHLFPDGAGDYSTPRNFGLSLGDYAKHLMQFRCPRFRTDLRFKFYIENMVMRWRALEVGRVFVHDNKYAGLSAKEMIEALNDPAVLASVSVRASDLRGTSAYWQSKGRQLEAMIRTLGVPHFFVTLSAADVHWPELQHAWGIDAEQYESNVELRAEMLSKLQKDPGMADTVFWLRFETCLKRFLVEHWKVNDYWFRIEYQSRGSPHVHGCIWMPDGVDVTSNTLNAEELTSFVDKYICSWNLAMDESDYGNQVLNGSLAGQGHPAQLKPEEIENDKQDLQLISHLTERHTICSKKCLRTVKGKQECRFKYPREPQEKTVAKRVSRLNWQVETQRNDERMISHSPQLLCMWRANVDVQMISSVKNLIRYLIKYATKSEKESDYMAELTKRLHKELEDNAEQNADNNFQRSNTARRVVQQHLMAQVGARDYSAQEAMHLLLQTSMYKGSREFVFVQTGETRAVEEKGVCRNSCDKYSKRAKNLENVTMFRFFSDYCLSPNGRCTKRPKQVVLLISPFFRPNEQSDERREGYYRQQVLLYSCWRNEREAKGLHTSWQQAYEAMPAENRCELQLPNLDDLRNDEADEEVEAVAELPEMTNANAQSAAQPTYEHEEQEDWMVAVGALHRERNLLACPEDQLPKPPENFDWSAASGGQFPTVGEAKAFLSSDLKLGAREVADMPINSVESLNVRQREMYNLIESHLQLSRLAEENQGEKPEPLKAILYGSAGTGKSYLISTLRRLIGESRCRIMASTGVAAFNIAGETLHSALKLNVNFSAGVGKKSLMEMQEQWKDVRYIFIDEFSMLGQRLLRKVDARLRELFPEHSKQSFGGRSVILIGDVFQLPPVLDTQLYVYNPNQKKHDILKSEGYKLYMEFKKVVHLTEQVRQANDTEFAQLLDKLREGKADEACWNSLMNNCRVYAPDLLPEGFQSGCTFLYHTNEDVRNRNYMLLGKMVSELNPVRQINAICKGDEAKLCGKKKEHKKSDTNLEKRLYLCIGARVMLTRNLSVRNGLVNGSVGTVRGICYAPGRQSPKDWPDCIWVEFDNYSGPAMGAIVQDNRAIRVVPILSVTNEKFKGGAQLSRQQFPLRLAWASTIHKSQGLTIPKAYVAFSKGGARKAIPAGLFYTAVSRVRAFADLRVSSCDYNNFVSLFSAQKVQTQLHEQKRLLRMCSSANSDSR